jgi:predicted deacylase
MLAALAAGQVRWEPAQSLVRIAVQQHEEYRVFQQLGLVITDARDNYVKALGTEQQLASVRALGFSYEVLLADYAADPSITGGQSSIADAPRAFYHTYEQVRDSLGALASRHPDICRLETLGYSVQNRLLLGLRISDNIGQREAEPRCRLDGNIHGNEKIGCEVVLYAAYVLAESSGLSPRVTELVNNAEILCVPMVNPDGAVANQRTNANGVDLNRDFGYMWDGWGQSPDWFSQPETRALRLDCQRNRYSMSISFHSGAKVIIYPWMYTGVPTPDDLLFKRLVYAYHSSAGYDTMRSYRWYQTHGQSFDSRYGLDGTLEITTELHESNPPVESIDYYCRLNREAVLYFLERSLTGVHGMVSDATNGMPVGALIRIKPEPGTQDWFVYSTPEDGDFHRPLLAGTYALSVSANGYRDTLITGVVVSDTLTPVVLQIALEPGLTAAACGLICVQQNDTTGLVNTSLTQWVLGNPDQRSYSMSFRGRLVLDFGEGSEITNGAGPDFTVVEHPDAGDTIWVWAGRNWNGPWTSVGRGIGTCSLDLAGTGIDTARYLLIRDAGRGGNASPTAGFDLDAVVALHHATGAAGPLATLVNPPVRDCRPNPFVSFTSVRGHEAESFTLCDATGRTVGRFQCDRVGAGLAAGVYFVRGAGSSSLRLVKLR